MLWLVVRVASFGFNSWLTRVLRTQARGNFRSVQVHFRVLFARATRDVRSSRVLRRELNTAGG